MPNYTINAERELRDFENSLRQSDAETVMNSAYELIIKRELFITLQEFNLSPETVEILDSTPCPLSYLYSEWLASSYSGTEMFEEMLRDLDIRRRCND